MGIFDWLLGKKSKDKEEKDVGIEKGKVKKKRGKIGDARAVDTHRKVQPKKKMEYFKDETLPDSGDGLCSDNNCPCPEVRIPRGGGYIYISQEIVDFRNTYRTPEAARAEMQRRFQQMGAGGFYRIGPILVCEQGAKLRNLDLEVAAADAKYWWETGKVPLRATPLADKGHKKV
jgi:hypothetical protein